MKCDYYIALATASVITMSGPREYVYMYIIMYIQVIYNMK